MQPYSDPISPSDIVVALVNLTPNELPLLFVRCAEHFHSHRDVAQFENGLGHCVPLSAQILLCRADEHLILFFHGGTSV